MKKLRKGRIFTKSSKKKGEVIWENANDVKVLVRELLKELSLEGIEKERLFFFRSYNTSTRAVARIWGFPRIWQSALKQDPAYCIEVISEKFDKMNDFQKRDVLIHELVHIPKNFSGSLIPHVRKGKRNFYKKVKSLINISKRKIL